MSQPPHACSCTARPLAPLPHGLSPQPIAKSCPMAAALVTPPAAVSNHTYACLQGLNPPGPLLASLRAPRTRAPCNVPGCLVRAACSGPTAPRTGITQLQPQRSGGFSRTRGPAWPHRPAPPSAHTIPPFSRVQLPCPVVGVPHGLELPRPLLLRRHALRLGALVGELGRQVQQPHQHLMDGEGGTGKVRTPPARLPVHCTEHLASRVGRQGCSRAVRRGRHGTSNRNSNLRNASYLPAEVGVELGLIVDHVHVPAAVPKLHVEVREVGRDGLAQALQGGGQSRSSGRR